MMRVEIELVIVLVLLLESQGSITGLLDLNTALGGISTGPQGCTSTCCMTCHLGDNCQICYKLNPPGSPNCPCIDTLDLSELRRLLELPLSLAQSRGRAGGKVGDQEGDRVGGQEGVRVGGQGGGQTGGRGGGCVPECCPSMTCTKRSCPLCFRRHRTALDKCPCSKW